jgi:hypothetical protein
LFFTKVRPLKTPRRRKFSVSHDPADATIDARAVWYQSLTYDERLRILADAQRLIWDLNGGRMPRKLDVQRISDRCEVLELPQSVRRQKRR